MRCQAYGLEYDTAMPLSLEISTVEVGLLLIGIVL